MLFNNTILSILNKILQVNEGSLLLLKEYSGNTFSINIIGLLKIVAKLDNDGFLSTTDNTSYTTDISVPFSISPHLIQNNQLEMIKEVQINGDKQFGLDLLKIFSNLKFSHVNYNHGIVAVTLQNTLEKFFKSIKNTLQLVFNNANNSISEYLQYETQNIVSRYEIDQFCVEVDEIRERTNLLEKHLNLLGNKKI